MYNIFDSMYIKEKKELFDLSDHCLLKADFSIVLKNKYESRKNRVFLCKT